MSVLVPYTYPKEFNGIALVGEAPGAEEVEQMKGFVGDAGKTMDSGLDVAGICRNNCFITNIFRIRPTDNKIALFFSPKKDITNIISLSWGTLGGRYIRPEYMDEIHHLVNELCKLQPKIVVTLGNTALWALTGLEEITKNRGNIYRCRFGVSGYSERLPILATYHPSFIMRNKSNDLYKTQFHQDLTVANQISKGQIQNDYKNSCESAQDTSQSEERN